MNSPQSYLLDTNIASYIVKGSSPAARDSLKGAIGESRVLISSLSEAELLFGLEIRPQATALRRAVHELLGVLEISPWDSSAALAYSRLRAYLRATGNAMANMDLLIASHAMALGATLVSHDRVFHSVAPHLEVVDWASDLP